MVRPTLAAMLGYLFAGRADTLGEAADQWWYAFLGGGTTLASHLVEMGIHLRRQRLAQPVTNVTVSLGEDIAVVAIITLVLYHPWLALAIAVVLFAIGVAVAVRASPGSSGAAGDGGGTTGRRRRRAPRARMSEAPEDMVRLRPWERH